MMGNVRFFMVISLIVSLTAGAWAVEVISIDINNYGQDTAYSGQAAVDGATEWVVYYGGWGEPVGSPRSENLAAIGTVQAGTYAEQVWVGDQGGHDYITGAGDGLLDDGFAKNTVGDPNLMFFGADTFVDVADQTHAYSGTYDLYVYGNSAGDFYLTDVNDLVLASGSVTGTTDGFVEGENYVVFEAVEIASPGSVFLWYTNELNGLQLVPDKTPFAVSKTATDPNLTTIDAIDYDVAYDTNARDGEFTLYGPDTGNYVHYLDSDESMSYDLVVDAANEGMYDVSADVIVYYGDANLSLYLDGVSWGTLEYEQSGNDTIYETNAVTLNLFEGDHTVTWAAETSDIYFDVVALHFSYVGDITLEDCTDVYKHGYELAGDVNRDCRVNLEDLVVLAGEWTSNYNLLAQ